MRTFTLTGIVTWASIKETDKWGAYTMSILPEKNDEYEALALAIPDVAEDEGIYVTMADCLRQLGETGAEYLNNSTGTDSFHESDTVFKCKNKQQPLLMHGAEDLISGCRASIVVSPSAYSFVTSDGKELDGVTMRLHQVSAI